ncbi:hypothetical protein [Primorskyibacter flagellatus]|uniref:Uncharacterized protein n=1 Tax=Primorskyibacter flagellatus TaxID=1387277 RepID=A0A1W2C654_9RHOB|nr:hypothetical protein [Primorskyibacter flagellatus]SMC80620.1 hypothetical protein SAMN06295998_10658 [Primorskyibacter flagellatus]
MESDLYLVLGCVLGTFSITRAASALADGRAPIFALIMLIVGGGLVGYAYHLEPGGLTFDDVPRAFAAVIGRIIN